MTMQPIENVLVLVNPVAGRGQLHMNMGDVERAFQRCGVKAKMVLLSDPDMALKAVETQAREMSAVVAVGGDGTANLAAKAILSAGGDWPLGLIPLGFGNCLARSLGLPLDVDAAVDVVARGCVRTLDLAWVRERPVVYTLGAGFDADIITRVSEARVGGVWMGDYLKAFWNSFWHYDWPEIEVEVDNRLLEGRYAQVILSAVQVYAVFFKLRPSAGFQAYLFRKPQPKDLYNFLVRGLSSDLTRAADLSVPVKSSLRMTSAPTPVPMQIDGEVGGFLPVTCDIKPDALKVLVPSADD